MTDAFIAPDADQDFRLLILEFGGDKNRDWLADDLIGLLRLSCECIISISWPESQGCLIQGGLTCPMTPPLGGTLSNLCAAYRSKASIGQSK